MKQEEVIGQLKKKLAEKQRDVFADTSMVSSQSQTAMTTTKTLIKQLRGDNQKISENLNELVKTNF